MPERSPELADVGAIVRRGTEPELPDPYGLSIDLEEDSIRPEGETPHPRNLSDFFDRKEWVRAVGARLQIRDQLLELPLKPTGKLKELLLRFREKPNDVRHRPARRNTSLAARPRRTLNRCLSSRTRLGG